MAHPSLSRLLPNVADLPDPVRGAGWYIAAGACWAGAGVIVRHLSAELHPFEIAFFRSLFGFLPLLFWMIPKRVPLLPRRRIGLYSLRGLCEVGALFGWFSAVALIPLADVVALSFTAPLFATILAVLALGERAGVRRWAAIAVGMAGALVILRPGFQDISTGALIALAAAVAIAGSRVTTRRLALTEPVPAIVATIALFTVPCTFVPMLFVWQTPTPTQLLLMLALGGLATLGHVCIALAFRVSEASELAPYDFAQLLLAVLFGALAFGEFPGAWTWLGGALVAGTAVYVIRREARLHRQGRVRQPVGGPAPPGSAP